MLLTDCSAQENRSCTSPVQQSRADPGGGGGDKAAPEAVTMGELAQPLVYGAATWVKERCPPLYPLPPMADKRAVPAPWPTQKVDPDGRGTGESA